MTGAIRLLSLGMKRPLSLAVVANTLVGGIALAGDLPDLPDTFLYKELAHDCHPVDLTTWSHPTKQVLGRSHVQLDALELCNSGKYPVFHVKFDYDPMGPNDSFFVPFYNAMFRANGLNAMAFVETTSGNVIVTVANDHGRPKASYEQYKP